MCLVNDSLCYPQLRRRVPVEFAQKLLAVMGPRLLESAATPGVGPPVTADHGSTKLAAQVARVEQYGPHQDDADKGDNLDTRVLLNMHFKNLLDSSGLCQEVIPDNETIIFWQRCVDMRKAAELVRKGRRCNFAQGEVRNLSNSCPDAGPDLHRGK